VRTTTTNSSGSGNADFEFGDRPTTAASTQINNNYFFLFLLFIPLFLIIFLIFICCCGRCCQTRTYSCCRLLFCPCFRPDDQSEFTDKYYDATICFAREDKYWVEQFICEICLPKNNYKIHKQCMSPKSYREPLNKENEKILRRSKRIILVFTKEFCEANFNNPSFIELLRELYRNDSNCVIVALNKGYDKKVIQQEIRQKIEAPFIVEETGADGQILRKPRRAKRAGCCSSLANHVKYHCGLSDIEILDYNDKRFYKKFHYVMPIMPYDETKPSIVTHSKTRANDSFEYASDYKNTANLRQIIVPIPEFMRTKLGFGKKHHPTRNVGDLDSSIQPTMTSADQDHHAIHISTLKSPKYPNIDFQSHSNGQLQPQQTLNITQHNSGGRRLSTVSSAVNEQQQFASGLRMYQNQEATTSLTSTKPRSTSMRSHGPPQRSETPDILAMFAPNPSTVVHIEKQQQRSSSRGRRGSKHTTHRSSSTENTLHTTTTAAGHIDDSTFNYDV
jgi:hypothetical protein